MNDFCLVHPLADSFKVGDKVRLRYQKDKGEIYTVIKIEPTSALYPSGSGPIGNLIFVNDSPIGWWPRNVEHI